MASVSVNIQIDNVPEEMNYENIVQMIEGIIRNHTGMDVVTSVFDNDGNNTSNPIYTYESMQKVR